MTNPRRRSPAGGDVRKVRDPQHVRARRPELAVHAVQRAWRGLVADRRLHASSANDAMQAHSAHQPGHRAARHIFALSHQLTPDLADTVDLEVLIEHPSISTRNAASRWTRGGAVSGRRRRAS